MSRSTWFLICVFGLLLESVNSQTPNNRQIVDRVVMLDTSTSMNEFTSISQTERRLQAIKRQLFAAIDVWARDGGVWVYFYHFDGTLKGGAGYQLDRDDHRNGLKRNITILNAEVKQTRIAKTLEAVLEDVPRRQLANGREGPVEYLLLTDGEDNDPQFNNENDYYEHLRATLQKWSKRLDSNVAGSFVYWIRIGELSEKEKNADRKLDEQLATMRNVDGIPVVKSNNNNLADFKSELLPASLTLSKTTPSAMAFTESQQTDVVLTLTSRNFVDDLIRNAEIALSASVANVDPNLVSVEPQRISLTIEEKQTLVTGPVQKTIKVIYSKPESKDLFAEGRIDIRLQSSANALQITTPLTRIPLTITSKGRAEVKVTSIQGPVLGANGFAVVPIGRVDLEDQKVTGVLEFKWDAATESRRAQLDISFEDAYAGFESRPKFRLPKNIDGVIAAGTTRVDYEIILPAGLRIGQGEPIRGLLKLRATDCQVLGPDGVPVAVLRLPLEIKPMAIPMATVSLAVDVGAKNGNHRRVEIAFPENEVVSKHKISLDFDQEALRQRANVVLKIEKTPRGEPWPTGFAVAIGDASNYKMDAVGDDVISLQITLPQQCQPGIYEAILSAESDRANLVDGDNNGQRRQEYGLTIVVGEAPVAKATLLKPKPGVETIEIQRSMVGPTEYSIPFEITFDDVAKRRASQVEVRITDPRFAWSDLPLVLSPSHPADRLGLRLPESTRLGRHEINIEIRAKDCTLDDASPSNLTIAINLALPPIPRVNVVKPNVPCEMGRLLWNGGKDIEVEIPIEVGFANPSSENVTEVQIEWGARGPFREFAQIHRLTASKPSATVRCLIDGQHPTGPFAARLRLVAKNAEFRSGGTVFEFDVHGRVSAGTASLMYEESLLRTIVEDYSDDGHTIRFPIAVSWDQAALDSGLTFSIALENTSPSDQDAPKLTFESGSGANIASNTRSINLLLSLPAMPVGGRQNSTLKLVPQAGLSLRVPHGATIDDAIELNLDVHMPKKPLSLGQWMARILGILMLVVLVVGISAWWKMGEPPWIVISRVFGRDRVISLMAVYYRDESSDQSAKARIFKRFKGCVLSYKIPDWPLDAELELSVTIENKKPLLFMKVRRGKVTVQDADNGQSISGINVQRLRVFRCGSFVFWFDGKFGTRPSAESLDFEAQQTHVSLESSVKGGPTPVAGQFLQNPSDAFSVKPTKLITSPIQTTELNSSVEKNAVDNLLSKGLDNSPASDDDSNR